MAGTESKRARSFWFDPRFAIGLALVLVSVVGVVVLVARANASVVVLAARTTLTPGERVTASDLVATSVRAGAPDALYLRRAGMPRGGVVITRAVSAGELVPLSAVGSAVGADLTSVVVSVDSALAASIVPGSRVDLWAADQAAATDAAAGGSTTAQPGAFDAPSVLVSSATVVRIIDQKNLVATPGESIELLVPKSDTASVLDAAANGAALSVVPVDLPLGQ